jgi:hypothetical protein
VDALRKKRSIRRWGTKLIRGGSMGRILLFGAALLLACVLIWLHDYVTMKL